MKMKTIVMPATTDTRTCADPHRQWINLYPDHIPQDVASPETAAQQHLDAKKLGVKRLPRSDSSYRLPRTTALHLKMGKLPALSVPKAQFPSHHA